MRVYISLYHYMYEHAYFRKTHTYTAQIHGSAYPAKPSFSRRFGGGSSSVSSSLSGDLQACRFAALSSSSPFVAYGLGGWGGNNGFGWVVSTFNSKPENSKTPTKLRTGHRTELSHVSHIKARERAKFRTLERQTRNPSTRSARCWRP